MLRNLVYMTGILLIGIGLFCAESVQAADELDPARIAEIAGWLPAEPRGGGPAISDRQAWEKVAAAAGFSGVVRRAEQLLERPMPELTDELFLDFSRTGNRERCQRVLGERHGRLPALVMAECIENRGRFLPAIEEAVGQVCSEKTWVMPAHDGRLANFEGKTIEIDLAVAAISWDMATAHFWLGERLSPATRRLIRDELERRTLGPMESYLKTGRPRLWWPTGTSNWNAVCMAGVTGTALAMERSAERRAMFAAAAEKYSEYFKKGFTRDGYCSEGMGYWNYGFGNFTLLAEALLQATGGRLDLFADPLIEEVAKFGPRMEIIPGVYPAFADCSIGSRPDVQLMAFLSRRFRLGMSDVERKGLGLAGGPQGSLFAFGLYGFENSASAVPAVKDGLGRAPRDWFSEAGIMICRPDDPARGMGAALKGGHNAEHHNHNDVGSYVVALAGETPLLDPGGEIYTARTFSGKRYESKVLNSFGHPVPRIADTLQKTGRDAAAKVLKAELTDRADRLTLDLRSAYPAPGLEKLERTFVFSRQGRGSLAVTDEVQLAEPAAFETALITLSKWRADGAGLRIGEGDAALRVAIDAGGAAFTIADEEIHENLSRGRVPVRLAVRLNEPVRSAKVTVTITPESE